ncbi:hypothetical protein LV83_01680 [Algoriphagus yeomjeoni]|uniref:Uncharacterized protein n=1 Tax=Algoriphagus yeomjeoni TaxID=291403 RepID=A0A327PIN0_9BACT|nr:hypothetical protein LV83_01680 [Algoriphagus yeomjeoni]
MLESDSSQIIEFLLQALEINRSLIAAMNKDWDTEEELYQAVQILTNQQKELEYKVAQKLNP